VCALYISNPKVKSNAMPYPLENPSAKYDMIGPRLPPTTGKLNDLMGFANTAAIFQALNTEPPRDLKLYATVYSYPSDSPEPPLSRKLCVIGVADIGLSIVRKLTVNDDDDTVPECLHKCLIAVKHCEGDAAHRMPSKDVDNSRAFANFVRRLHTEGVVAILSQDKFQRFAILKPSEEMMIADGEFNECDFFAECYVGNVSKVKAYLTKGAIRPVQAPSLPSKSAAPEDGLRQPPETNGKSNGKTEGMWQPPDMDDNTTELWQPPGTNVDSSTDSFAWQPPDSNPTLHPTMVQNLKIENESEIVSTFIPTMLQPQPTDFTRS
jgi:hypothetical protein